PRPLLRSFPHHPSVPRDLHSFPTRRSSDLALAGDAPAPGDSAAMTGIVEKPSPAQAPSNLSVVGRYVLPADIFPLLANTAPGAGDRKSTRLNSSHVKISYAVFCLKKKKKLY